MFFKDRQVSVWIFVLCASKLTLAKKVDERGFDVSRILAMRNEAKAVAIVVLTAISIVVVVVVVVVIVVVVMSTVVVSVSVAIAIVVVVVVCYSSYAGVLILNGSIISIVLSILVDLTILVDLSILIDSFEHRVNNGVYW